MPPREIQIASRCEPLRFSTRSVESWLRRLDRPGVFSLPAGDLSVVFFDDDEMTASHSTYLGDPSPTDVITFPGDPAFEEAGEICVGARRAWEVHRDHRSSFSNEILLYLAHGWLHLFGYDDRSEEDRLAMRDAERRALLAAAVRSHQPRFEWRG